MLVYSYITCYLQSGLLKFLTFSVDRKFIFQRSMSWIVANLMDMLYYSQNMTSMMMTAFSSNSKNHMVWKSVTEAMLTYMEIWLLISLILICEVIYKSLSFSEFCLLIVVVYSFPCPQFTGLIEFCRGASLLLLYLRSCSWILQMTRCCCFSIWSCSLLSTSFLVAFFKFQWLKR